MQVSKGASYIPLARNISPKQKSSPQPLATNKSIPKSAILNRTPLNQNTNHIMPINPNTRSSSPVYRTSYPIPHQYPSQQQQTVILNNKKFLKRLSPPKQQQCHAQPHINPFSSQCPSQQNTRIRILQSRVAQLHTQKQKQLIEVLKEKSRLERELEEEKTRTRAVMARDTPIRKINGSFCERDWERVGGEDICFDDHDVRIEGMKRRIRDLEEALERATSYTSLGQQARSLNPFDTILEHENNLKSSIAQRKLQVNTCECAQLSFQLYNTQKKQQNLSLYIKKMQKQFEQKNKIIIEKEEEIKKLQAKNQELIQNLKVLTQQIDLLRKIQQNKSYQVNKIPISYAQSQSLDLTKLRDQKLHNISLRQSVLINDNWTIKNRLSQFSEQEPHHQLQYPTLHAESHREQQLNQQSMTDILMKMKLLTDTNDRIQTENKMLVQRMATMEEGMRGMEDTLRLAYDRIQGEEDCGGLMGNWGKVQRESSNIGDRFVEFQLSKSGGAGQWFQQPQCQNCKQVSQIISKLTSEYNINLTDTITNETTQP